MCRMNKLALLIVLVSTCAMAADPTVKGTLTANGTATKLTHVAAYEVDSTTEKGTWTFAWSSPTANCRGRWR